MAITFQGYDKKDNSNQLSVDQSGRISTELRYIFELTGDDRGRYQDIMSRAEIPIRGAKHPFIQNLKATGRHTVTPTATGNLVEVACEFDSRGGEDNGREPEKPWNQGILAFDVTTDVVTETSFVDYDGNPVVSSSGTRLIVPHDVNYPVVNLRYALRHFDWDDVLDYRNSVNKSNTKIAGMYFRANLWKMRSINASAKIVFNRQGGQESYWEISMQLQGDPVQFKINGKTEYRAWRSVAADMSRCKRVSGGGFMPLYAYQEPGKKVEWKTWAEWEEAGYTTDPAKRSRLEQVSEPIWLDGNGEPAPIRSGYQEPHYLFFSFRNIKSWNNLNIPSKEPKGL